MVTKTPEHFVTSIIDTRNYLTHYSDELKEGALEGAELHNANLRLRILIMIFLFKELGLDEEKIAPILARNTKIAHAWVRYVEYDSDTPVKQIDAVMPDQ